MSIDISFKVGKDTLRGTLFTPSGKGPFPAVIFFHGSGGRGEKYYEAGEKFPQKGIVALAFNFRGCGRSDGSYSTQTFANALEDAQKAFDFLLSKNIDPQRIGVVGGSFGGFVVAMLLPKIKVKSLVLLGASAHDESLLTKIDKGGSEKEVAYFKNKSNWENSQSYKNVANFKNPVLIIKSGNDENVPHEVTDKYFQKAVNSSKKEIRIIEGADHRLSEQKWRNEFCDIILDWFLKTL